jgi:schlafen family protein
MFPPRITAVREIEKRIAERVQRRSDYSGQQFERDVTELLDTLFPYSVLSGVRLFSARRRGRIAYGYEIDNLLHVRHRGADYIVLIDAKRQTVAIEGNRWTVQYDDGKKCAKQQLDLHLQTTWEYVQPISGTTELKFLGIVASSDTKTTKATADGYHNAKLVLCSFRDLADVVLKEFSLLGDTNGLPGEVLRISQSYFLDLLRLSLPVPQLGHPEIANALRYIERCRRNLDESLFEDFDPTPERWVINGCAGTGKSVLLAYTAAVLSSGYELCRSLGEVDLKSANNRLSRIRYDSDPRRSGIAIVAMSAKQLESLQRSFTQFVEKFQAADVQGSIRFRQPDFVLCRSSESLAGAGNRWSAILVDEAHDLPAYAAQQITRAYQEQKPYLVLACDRHQRLQLAGSDARILPGVDFTNRSKRLRQIYRSPAPVYIASLALMFRWCGDTGPKVMPTIDQIVDYFGFEAQR